MREIGPLTSEIEVVAQHGDDTWAVRFDDESIVTVEWVESPSRWVLSAILGRPVCERKIEIYEALLSYNSLVNGTGWLGRQRAAVVRQDTVVLIHELHAEQLTLAQLRDALLAFTDGAGDWRSFIADPADPNFRAPLAAPLLA